MGPTAVLNIFVNRGGGGCEYKILDNQKHPHAKGGLAGNRTLESLYDLLTPQRTNHFIRINSMPL